MLFREALQAQEEDAYERVRACNRKCNKTISQLHSMLRVVMPIT